MWRAWFVVPVVLGACVRSMVRAPTQIPADGVVECTDSFEIPLAAAGTGLLAGGTAVYAMAEHPEGTIRAGGLFWVPLLAVIGSQLLFEGVVGATYANDCRRAKQHAARGEAAPPGAARRE